MPKLYTAHIGMDVGPNPALMSARPLMASAAGSKVYARNIRGPGKIKPVEEFPVEVSDVGEQLQRTSNTIAFAALRMTQRKSVLQYKNARGIAEREYDQEYYGHMGTDWDSDLKTQRDKFVPGYAQSEGKDGFEGLLPFQERMAGIRNRIAESLPSAARGMFLADQGSYNKYNKLAAVKAAANLQQWELDEVDAEVEAIGGRIADATRTGTFGDVPGIIDDGLQSLGYNKHVSLDDIPEKRQELLRGVISRIANEPIDASGQLEGLKEQIWQVSDVTTQTHMLNLQHQVTQRENAQTRQVEIEADRAEADVRKSNNMKWLAITTDPKKSSKVDKEAFRQLAVKGQMDWGTYLQGVNLLNNTGDPIPIQEELRIKRGMVFGSIETDDAMTQVAGYDRASQSRIMNFGLSMEDSNLKAALNYGYGEIEKRMGGDSVATQEIQRVAKDSYEQRVKSGLSKEEALRGVFDAYLPKGADYAPKPITFSNGVVIDLPTIGPVEALKLFEAMDGTTMTAADNELFYGELNRLEDSLDEIGRQKWDKDFNRLREYYQKKRRGERDIFPGGYIGP